MRNIHSIHQIIIQAGNLDLQNLTDGCITSMEVKLFSIFHPLHIMQEFKHIISCKPNNYGRDKMPMEEFVWILLDSRSSMPTAHSVLTLVKVILSLEQKLRRKELTYRKD